MEIRRMTGNKVVRINMSEQTDLGICLDWIWCAKEMTNWSWMVLGHKDSQSSLVNLQYPITPLQSRQQRPIHDCREDTEKDCRGVFWTDRSPRCFWSVGDKTWERSSRDGFKMVERGWKSRTILWKSTERLKRVWLDEHFRIQHERHFLILDSVQPAWNLNGGDCQWNETCQRK